MVATLVGYGLSVGLCWQIYLLKKRVKWLESRHPVYHDGVEMKKISSQT